MNEMTLVKRITRNVEGMLSDREGRFLYDAAKSCRGKGVILEIGSFKGKSTIWLARGSQSGSGVKVYCVDPFIETNNYRRSKGEISLLAAFSKNISDAGVSDTVVPFVGTSAERAKDWDRPIELLWIDGDHSYEMVRLDFELWSPHLVEGGIIAFHNTLWTAGPRRVLRESIYGSRYFKDIGLVGKITYARKTSRGTLAGAISSVYALSISNVCGWAVGRKLPRPLKRLGRKLIGL